MSQRRRSHWPREVARRRSIIALAVSSCRWRSSPIASGGSAYDADRVLSLPTVGAVSNQFAGYGRRSPRRVPIALPMGRAVLLDVRPLGELRDPADDRVEQRWTPESELYRPLERERAVRRGGLRGRSVPNPNTGQGGQLPVLRPPARRRPVVPVPPASSPHSMAQGIDELYNALVHVVARRGLQRSPLFLTANRWAARTCRCSPSVLPRRPALDRGRDHRGGVRDPAGAEV